MISNQLIKDNLEKHGFEFFTPIEYSLRIKSQSGSEHRIFIQEINLNKERSVKIQVGDLGEPSNNRWVCLVLTMENMEPMLYLIPSLKLAAPDNFIFKYNKLKAPFEHLSNYEIKVFRNGMEELSKYAFENIIGELA